MANLLAGFCLKLSVLLAACLPLIIFFDTSRNIDAQGLLVILLGITAWLAVILKWPELKTQLNNQVVLLLGAYILTCLISLALNPNKDYGILGAPYIRLGAAGLIACIGSGLLFKLLPTTKLITGLYVGLLTLGTLSIPYSLIRFQSLDRLPGLFAQADIMAVFVGCGILLGLYVLHLYPAWRRYIMAGQFGLALVLILTGTRAVIILTAALAAAWLYQQRTSLKRQWPLYLVALVVTLTLLSLWAPDRLTSPHHASKSLSYRLDLQQQALRATAEKPLFGYGPGNLADALDCSKMSAPSLHDSCQKGFFFNSSHNIFLDRVLQIGWLGGLAYFGLVVIIIYQGLKRRAEVRIMAFAALLIAGYYFTNVTSVALELLFWILLIGGYQYEKTRGRSKTSLSSTT